VSAGRRGELISAALEARGRAYCPYSGFAVGAALLTASGELYRGCNIENSAYSVTVCAERTALFSAVSAGERSLEALAVVAAGQAPPRPCGPCLQALAEFNPRLVLYLATPEGAVDETTLAELMPEPFRLKVETAQ
jgi:cytidine deaminase